MKTKIDIDTRTFIRFWLIIVGFFLVATLVYKAQTALLIIGVSLFLALALNSPVSRISRRLPSKSRVGATAISYVAVVAFLGAIVFLALPPIIQQSAQFAQRIPDVVQSTTDQWGALRNFVDEYNLRPQLDSALGSLQRTAGEWAGNIGQNIVTGIGSIFSFFAAAILVFVLTFLMLIEGPTWLDKIFRVMPNQSKMPKYKRVLYRMYLVVSGYVNGQLTVSAIGATSAGLFVFLLSFIFPAVPSSLAMPAGALTFVFSLIPMFGATICGLLVALLLALNSIPAAIIYGIFFVIYQQLENNFISPHIQSKRIELSALIVLGAVTIGLYMFGIVGGIVAIPVAGSIKVLIEEYLDGRKDQTGIIEPKETVRPAAPKAKLIAKN